MSFGNPRRSMGGPGVPPGVGRMREQTPGLRTLVATPAGGRGTNMPFASGGAGMIGVPPTPSSGAVPKASRSSLPPAHSITTRTTRTKTIDLEARDRFLRENMAWIEQGLPPPEDFAGFAPPEKIMKTRLPTELSARSVAQTEDVSQSFQGSGSRGSARPKSGQQLPPASGVTKRTVKTVTTSGAADRSRRIETRVESIESQAPQRPLPREVAPSSGPTVARQMRPRVAPPARPTPAAKVIKSKTSIESVETSQSGPRKRVMRSTAVETVQSGRPSSGLSSRTPMERYQDPRSVKPAVIKTKSVETTEQPGRTVRVVKTSERTQPPQTALKEIVSARTGPTPGGLGGAGSERARRISTSTVKPIPPRGVKVVKSTTSQESVKSGPSKPIYQKRTKIVESTTSIESVGPPPSIRLGTGSEKSKAQPMQMSSSRLMPIKTGRSRTAIETIKPQRPGQPPSKVVSRRQGDERQKGPEPRQFEREVEKQLKAMVAKAPRKSLKATGAKSGVIAPPMINTPYGPVESTKKIVSKKSLIRAPGQPEIIARGLTGIETVGPGRAEISEIEVQTLSPKNKAPEDMIDREVIEVTSSVAFGGGFVETTKIVSYDAPESPPKKTQLSPQQVAQLIAEENADIQNTRDLFMPELQASRPVTYPVKKNVEIELLHPESVSLLEHTVIPLVPTPDEEQEEPQPEMIATIMNTEERGLTMVSPPGNMYNYLFSDEKSELAMDVSSAAPAPLQDIVIPITMPDQSHEIAMTPAVIQASMNLQMHTEEAVPEDIYVETVGKELPKSKNTAKKGITKKTSKKGPLLSSQIPPWGIKDFEPVVDLVGAPPTSSFISVPEEDADEVVKIDPAEDGIEYFLEMEPPKHASRVQLRGSQHPSWFPGYYLALPHIPDVITLAKSPSVVFASAWKATQPDIFSEESLIVA